MYLDFRRCKSDVMREDTNDVCASYNRDELETAEPPSTFKLTLLLGNFHAGIPIGIFKCCVLESRAIPCAL